MCVFLCVGARFLVTKLRPNGPSAVAALHEIRVRAPTNLPLGARGAVNSFHNYGVRPEDVGEALDILATAPDGSVEAVAHKESPQWAIMWHPERSPNDPRDVALLHAIFKRGGL